MSLFKKNKNLRLYILSYLNRVDLVQFNMINSTWRDTDIYNRAFFNVFLYLQENLNFPNNENNYINVYHNRSLVKLIADHFSKQYEERDIINAIVDYFKVQKEILENNKILLDFHSQEEIDLNSEIFAKINKQDYDFYFDELRYNLFLDLDRAKILFSTIENLVVLKEDANLFTFLLQNDFKVKLTIKYAYTMQDYNFTNYFNRFPNSLVAIDSICPVNYLNTLLLYNNLSLVRVDTRGVNISEIETNLQNCINIEKIKINCKDQNSLSSFNLISKFDYLESLTIKNVKNSILNTQDIEFKNLQEINGLLVSRNNSEWILAYLHKIPQLISIKNLYFNTDIISEAQEFIENLKHVDLQKLSISIPKDTQNLDINLNKIVLKHQSLFYFKINHYHSDEYIKTEYLYKKFQIKGCFKIQDYSTLESSFAGLTILLKNSPNQTGFSILTDNVKLLDNFCSYLWQFKEIEILLRLYINFNAKEIVRGDYLKTLPLANSISLESYFEHIIPFLYCNVIRNLEIPRIDQNNKDILPFLNGKGLTDIKVANDEDMLMIKHIANNIEEFKYLKFLHIYYGRYPITNFDNNLIENLLKLTRLCYFGIEVYWEDNYKDMDRIKTLEKFNGITVTKAEF